jgi:hypothetical protein
LFLKYLFTQPEKILVQPGQQLNERRHYPRIATSLSAEVINRHVESINATITDLSMGGLSLEGDATIQQHIEVTDPKTGEPCFPAEASIHFDIELDNTPYHFDLQCRLVHKNRLSQNTLKLGMRILAIDEGEPNLLARYIEAPDEA